jgi:EAL domain-containing protein (putative c-di-GMP-specific phosphodiesterase class I)
MLSLAKGLGLEVCAEGVEEPFQAETLRDFGCNLAQGNFYSPPLPEKEMALLLQKGSITS